MKARAKFITEIERDERAWLKLANRVDTNTGHAVRTWAANVKRLAKGKSPVRTGFLRDSIDSERIGPKHWKVQVGASYGVYVEYGTRYMSAQPYFRPAIKVANKIFRQQVTEVFRNAND